MKNKVELPIVEPIYGTYHYQGSGSAIIADNPTIRNWYLNRIMILYCNDKFLEGFSTPQIGICYSFWESVPFIEKHIYDVKFIKKHIKSIIKELLDNGYYVFYTGVDDFYVKGKTWYKQRHFIHDGLICGYDQFKKTYSIFAYDSNWMYSKFKTSQKGFYKGMKSAIKQGEYGQICAIKAKQDRIEFEPKTAIKKISVYLDPTKDGFPSHYKKMILGIKVQEYMALYIDKLIDGSIPYEKMDWRIFRQIWEHKVIMLERIKKIEESLLIDNKSSSAYEKIVEQANTMRMLYASHHMKRRDQVLPLIRKMIVALTESEKEILSEFIERVEACNEIMENN